MKPSRNGQRCQLVIKYHVGVDIESVLAHTVNGNSGALHGVIEASSLVRPGDRAFYDDVGYQGTGRRLYARGDVSWHITMRPGRRRTLDMAELMDALIK